MMAGILQLDWRPHKLSELWIMYQCKILDDWDHTAHIMTMLCMSKGRKHPNMFHPFRDSGQKKTVKKENINDLADMAILL